MNPRSPFLTMDEAAHYLRFEQTKNPKLNAWKFCKRYAVPTYLRGRELLIRQAALQEALDDNTKAHRNRRRERTHQA